VTAWLARLRSAAQRLSAAGVVGIALLVFAVAFALSAVRPLRDEVARLEEEAAVLQRDLASGALTGAERPGVAGQLATFYAFFPAPETSPDWLGRIHAIAVRQGVELAAGEYRIERAPGTRLARYQMTLPVQGSYAQIRRFVGEVLEQVPAAALEEFTLRRDSVESPRVDARLRITLYFGSA
jgi:hypothetical protein